MDYKKGLFAMMLLSSMSCGAAVSFVGLTSKTPIGEATRIIDTKQSHYTTNQPDRDVIACQGNGQLCFATACRGTAPCTPTQFVKENGYNKIHKRSVVISGANQYIVLEVSYAEPVKRSK